MNTNVFKFVGAAIDIDAADVLEPGTPYASGDHVSRDRKSVHDLALDFNFPGIHMASSRFKIPEHSYGGGDVSENESEYSSNAGESPAENGSTAMGEKLKLAFELNNAESFKGEYACWLIKSVLLKGFMYLTDNHILFYAALPEQQLMIRRQGFLGKRSNPSKQYTNLYFLLKGSVLSYYDNSTDLYYPRGAIDLKTTVSISLSKKRKNGFKIVTTRKKYYLQADTDQQMTEWTNILQATLFRVKNEGDDVRVVLPFSRVTEIEFTKTSSFTDTIRVKVVDEDITASEEYFFAYFTDSKAVNTQLVSLWTSSKTEGPTVTRQRSMYDTTASTSLPPRPRSPPTPSSMKTSQSPLPLDIDVALPNDPRHRRTQSNESQSISKLTVQSTIVVSGSTLASPIGASPSPSDKSASPNFSPSASSDSDESVRRKPWWGARHRKTPSDGSAVMMMKEKEERERLEVLQIHFALPDTEEVQQSFTCYLWKVIPRLGKLYISQNYLCFKSKLVGVRSKVMIPISDLQAVSKGKAQGVFSSELYVRTRDQSEIFFEFHASESRNKCLEYLTLLLDMPPISSLHEKQLSAEFRKTSILENFGQLDKHLEPTFSEEDLNRTALTIPPTINGDTLVKSPPRLMHITCLTIGTRGDVQPFIALCKGLQAVGHKCRIATHVEYQSWIEEHGIEFRTVNGDPAELMQLCVDNGMFTVSFIREGLKRFRSWIDDLLSSAHEACIGTDMLIEAPSAMAGLHIAEHLRIPYFQAFTMPFTRTRAYPHPFAVPERNMGGSYNYMTHVLMEQIWWKGISAQINRWRKKELGLGKIELGNVAELKFPFLYCFSPAIVPPPNDWHDWIHPCGYWFLDNPDLNWKPDDSLVKFLAIEPKPLYIGFGSVVVQDPEEMTRTIIEACRKAGVRAILSKGWSGRMTKNYEQFEFPDFIFPVNSVPHDWLFPRVAGVVHHGGAGTTAAGIRAGVPTVIKPWFGDQYIWGDRVQDMGIGVSIKKLTVEKLSQAMTDITNDSRIVERAKIVGKRIRSEDGVGTAISFIHRDFEWSRQRINKLASSNLPTRPGSANRSSPLWGLRLPAVEPEAVSRGILPKA